MRSFHAICDTCDFPRWDTCTSYAGSWEVRVLHGSPLPIALRQARATLLVERLSTSLAHHKAASSVDARARHCERFARCLLRICVNLRKRMHAAFFSGSRFLHGTFNGDRD